MPPPPAWVQALKPSPPSGPELLAAERAGSDVQVDQLSELLHTRAVLDTRGRISNILANDPLFDKTDVLSMGRVEKVQRSLARGKALKRYTKQYNWSEEEYKMATILVGEPTTYGLHDSMFTKTLREQTTPEQKKLFLEPAEAHTIIGCYSQTELGHGSNVRGLETTATWNQADKTFIIHSPYLTASKWWSGTLGRTANHSIVMAQLYIDGKSYGPHPFIVNIRDLKTHEPKEGIYVGDHGPKFGYK